MSETCLPFVPDTPEALRVKCAVSGCERLAYDGSGLCGECREAQEAKAAAVWRGKDAIPGADLERALSEMVPMVLPEKPVTELMPETVCSRCESAIAAGAYRVEVSATSRERLGPWVETETIVRILCHACTMDPDEFLTGGFRTIKLDIEARAKAAASAAGPGQDALDFGRANTGQGQAPVKEDVHGNTIPTEPRSRESVQRETLGSFLNDRRSRNKLRPRQREVVRMYVQGMSQSEIARRPGLDPCAVSRMIQSALRAAI